jgi:predicted  nucleic acid-binding Zn-ribbon protein
MDIIEIENIFQQQFVKDMNEKIKQALGGQVQIKPIDVESLELTIDQHSEELKRIKEKMEDHTVVLNEIKTSLEQLNKLVTELNRPKSAWRIK